MELSEVLNTSPDIAAKRLLGAHLTRHIGHDKIVARIVETEAYDQDDPASHSYRGPTPRTQVMYFSAGFAYVYFTYGMHHCLNVVVGPKGHGSGVLIRAVEPLSGLNTMRANRQNVVNDLALANGPGKLCQALSIDKKLNGHNLANKPLVLTLKPALNKQGIETSKRIGITKATDTLWRFYIKNNSFVSKYT